MDKIVKLHQAFHQKRELLTILLLLISVILFYFPTIKDLKNTVISEDDWYGNYYYAGISRETILQYHQLPLRTPYLGGGYPSVAHPFDYALSPFLPLILMFGEVAGLRIMVFLIFITGALGMYYLVRQILKYNIIGSVFSVLTFAFCNWGVFEVVDGNIQKCFYYLLPWLFIFLIKSIKDKRFIILSCFALSPFVLNSGLSLIPVLLALFLFSCLNVVRVNPVRERSSLTVCADGGFSRCSGIPPLAGNPPSALQGDNHRLKLVTFSNGVNKKRQLNFQFSWLIIFLIIVSASCLLYAVKLFPMHELYLQRTSYIHLPYENCYSKISEAAKVFGSSLNLSILWKSLFDKNYLNYSSMYIGYLPVIIMIFSIFIFWRENLRYVILLAIFTLIQFGSNSPFDIFKIIWHIHPVIHGIWRLDKYFGFFIPFFIAIIAGKFFLIFNRRKILYFLVIPVVVFSMANMYLNNKSLFNNLIYEPSPKLKRYNTFFQVSIKDALISREGAGFSDIKDIRSYQPFWLLLKQNIGVVNFNWAGNIKISQNAIPKYFMPVGEIKGEVVYIKGYENLPDGSCSRGDLIAVGRNNPSYKGEAFFSDSHHQAKLTHFSPNIIEISVHLKNPDTLVINQNYHKSWKVNKGRLINYRGLLAVELKNIGKYDIKFCYVPLDFYVGMVVSLLTFMGMMGYLIFITKTKNLSNTAFSGK